ncbi:MAG: hypothetical protein LJE97_18660 [Betaproteobacteria bacterium]|nr:hypothetical protein [Betaproteobacteria bacterium]
MRQRGLPLLLVAMVCAFPAFAQAQMGTIRFDNWLYYQQNYDDSVRWQYRPRVFVPFRIGGGWTFTQRVDVPFYYTDKTGPANTSGDYAFHVSDALVEEIFDTPDVAKNFRFRASVRLVFPTGGQSPFGSDQWQVAPGAGFNWRLPDLLRGVTFAPYARYFFGFDPRSPGVTTVRRLDLFPTADFKLTGNWALSLYPEQGMSYNERSKKWFVPVEAMLVNQPSKKFAYAFGGAYALVDDDKSYRWLVEARLTFFF